MIPLDAEEINKEIRDRLYPYADLKTIVEIVVEVLVEAINRSMKK